MRRQAEVRRLRKPHIMKSFVFLPTEEETRAGQFGLKGRHFKNFTIDAVRLYYEIHTGRKADVHPQKAGDVPEAMVCVDARVPAPKGVGKTFGGLPILSEVEGAKSLAVVGHTDCGYMKLSLSFNMWLWKAGKPVDALTLINFAKSKEEDFPLAGPFKELVGRLSYGELKAFVEDMLERGMVMEKGGTLRPHFPLLSAHLPMEELDEEKALLLYTMEKVVEGAERLKGLLEAEVEPYIYITENGRLARITPFYDLVVYPSREERSAPLGTLSLQDLLEKGLDHPEVNSVLGLYR